MMRRFALAVLALASFSLTGCNDIARWAYDAGLSAEKARAGLQTTTVSTPDGIQWHLLRSETGQDKPAVLLVHGFGADSSNWVRFANELEGDYQFIIPDLPGHGASTRDLELDYATEHQAARLLTLMTTLGIEQFHMAGNSMGGAITIDAAVLAPQRVLSMGLVDAAGITLRTPEFDELVVSSPDSNPLIARSAEDMFTVMEWAMADPPWMPDFFVEVMGEKKAANAAVADKVWSDLSQHGADDEAIARLGTITTPTFILWGREDRLLGVDNAEIFKRELPDSELVILDGIGHVPMAETPGRSAALYDAFWQQVEKRRL